MVTDQLGLLMNTALAMILGGLIGLDREVADKPAGLRTHIMVSGSAALLTGLGNIIDQLFLRDFGADLLSSDPIRVIAAVITGISFLGAGTIIRQNRGQHVEGLTTAASLLFASGVGISMALSQFYLATGATILALIILRAIPLVQHLVGRFTR